MSCALIGPRTVLKGLFNFEVVSGGYVDAKGALDLRTASTWNRIRAVRIATS